MARGGFVDGIDVPTRRALDDIRRIAENPPSPPRGANLLANASFEDDDFASSFQIVEGKGNDVVMALSTTAPSSRVVRVGADNAGWGFRAVSVVPGKTYHVSAWIRTDVGSTGDLYFRILGKTDKPDSGFVVQGQQNTLTDLLGPALKSAYASATTWTALTYKWTVPAACRWATLSIYNWTGVGNLFFDHAVMQEQFGASFLAADAIKSSNYIAPVNPSIFSGAGSFLDLANGDFTMPGLRALGSGAVDVKGNITATSFTLDTPTTDIILAETFSPNTGLAQGHGLVRANTTLEFAATGNAITNRALNSTHTSAVPFFSHTDVRTTASQASASLYASRLSGGVNRVGLVDATASATKGAVSIYGSEEAALDSNGPILIGSYSTPSSITLKAPATRVQSTATPANAVLYLGDGSARLEAQAGLAVLFSPATTRGLYLHDTDNYWYLFNSVAAGAGYLDADTLYFRSGAGGQRAYINGSGIYVANNTFFRAIGTGGFYCETYGGGWSMSDTTWIRSYASKSIYTANAYICADAQGTLLAGVSGPISNNNRLYVRRDGSGTWADSHVVIRNAVAGNAQMAFHAVNVAPIIKAHSSAEAIEIRNNPDTAFAEIKASAFTVNSTLNSKINVAVEADDLILSRVRPSKQIRFRQKVRPQYIRKTERFKTLDVAWQASGKSPLTPKAEHLASADHDCALDECGGTATNPCSITLNDTDNIGLAAEEVFRYFPEAVNLDVDGLPAGLDIAQIATAAFAATGALLRKIEALEARLEAAGL